MRVTTAAIICSCYGGRGGLRARDPNSTAFVCHSAAAARKLAGWRKHKMVGVEGGQVVVRAVGAVFTGGGREGKGPKSQPASLHM